MIRLFLFCLSIAFFSCKENNEPQAIRGFLADGDSLRPGVKSHAKYEQYIYDPETGTTNFSYNYSGIWDFDGDGKKDSICFIGNGGAHVYFYLRIVLSSDGLLRDFRTVNMDFPLVTVKESLNKNGKKVLPQFVVHDFNNDGSPDIFLNFHDPYDAVNPIPKEWRKHGVKTEYVVMSFAENKLTVKDYFSPDY